MIKAHVPFQDQSEPPDLPAQVDQWDLPVLQGSQDLKETQDEMDHQDHQDQP